MEIREDSKITDHFKVGDKVKWMKISENKNQIRVRWFRGKIVWITGSTALIEKAAKQQVKVSLFELEVINNV